jgi:hypothetical protein
MKQRMRNKKAGSKRERVHPERIALELPHLMEGGGGGHGNVIDMYIRVCILEYISAYIMAETRNHIE